jgi:hypothetical protein
MYICMFRLGKAPLRTASIELIVDCSGGEQWSEHFDLARHCFTFAYPERDCRFAVCYAPRGPAFNNIQTSSLLS